jgi:hypothetical protein
MKLSTIAPIIVMLPIHFHPDDPNGSSPIPYPSEVTAPRMKKGLAVGGIKKLQPVSGGAEASLNLAREKFTHVP